MLGIAICKPEAIICLGLNDTDLIKEGGYDIPEYLALFMRGRNSIMAARAPLVRLPVPTVLIKKPN